MVIPAHTCACACAQERAAAIGKARGGPSIAGDVMQRLRQLLADHGGVASHTIGEVSECTLRADQANVTWQGPGSEACSSAFDRIVLATGYNPSLEANPLLAQLQALLPLPAIRGWPVLTPDLEWGAGSGIFLLGASAGKLAPGGQGRRGKPQLSVAFSSGCVMMLGVMACVCWCWWVWLLLPGASAWRWARRGQPERGAPRRLPGRPLPARCHELATPARSLEYAADCKAGYAGRACLFGQLGQRRGQRNRHRSGSGRRHWQHVRRPGRGSQRVVK